MVNYLNAADFSILTVKPTHVRLVCCAVKHGEYWANGLPIFVPTGIGDDSEVISKESREIVFDYNTNLTEKIIQLKRKLLSFNREEKNNISFRQAKKYKDLNIGFKIMINILNI